MVHEPPAPSVVQPLFRMENCAAWTPVIVAPVMVVVPPPVLVTVTVRGATVPTVTMPKPSVPAGVTTAVAGATGPTRRDQDVGR